MFGLQIPDFLYLRRASVALESVTYLAFMVGMVGTAFEIVTTHNAGDLLDRAAYAVARDHVLHERMPASRAKLMERAWDALRNEIGGALDPKLVTVKIDAYDNPSAMLGDKASTGSYSPLGGGPGDMVVVRLNYKPRTGFAWLRRQLKTDDVTFHALAVVRNESVLERVTTKDGKETTEIIIQKTVSEGTVSEGSSQTDQVEALRTMMERPGR